MRLIIGIVGALVLWGFLQGASDVELSQGQDSLVEAAGKIVSGVADTTVRLLPRAMDALSSLVDAIPDNGEYVPTEVGQ